MSGDEILTIREVVALLKFGEETTYTMAETGDLPAFKARGQRRFRRADIDTWIQARIPRRVTPPDTRKPGGDGAAASGSEGCLGARNVGE